MAFHLTIESLPDDHITPIGRTETPGDIVLSALQGFISDTGGKELRTDKPWPLSQDAFLFAEALAGDGMVSLLTSGIRCICRPRIRCAIDFPDVACLDRFHESVARRIDSSGIASMAESAKTFANDFRRAAECTAPIAGMFLPLVIGGRENGYGVCSIREIFGDGSWECEVFAAEQYLGQVREGAVLSRTCEMNLGTASGHYLMRADVAVVERVLPAD